MRNGWSKRALGSVAKIGAGNAAPQARLLFADGTEPFFRTSDVGRVHFGSIVEAADRLNAEGIRGLHRYFPGTILFPKSGASTFLNHRVILEVEGFVSSHLATICADTSQIEPRFLLYYLSTVSAQGLIQDHAYPSLNLPVIAGIPVPVPTLSEQRHLVSILDEAFSGLAVAKSNAETNLRNARAVFNSRLGSLFAQDTKGWVDKSVRQVASEGLILKPFDGNHGEIHPRKTDYTESGVPFIMASDLHDGAVDTEHCRFISRSQADSLRVGFAKDGDVLVSHKGTVGRSAIVSTNDEYIMLTPQVTSYRILDPEKLSRRFLRYYFMSPAFQREMTLGAGGGSTRAYIGITKQLGLRVRYPPIERQREIAEALDGMAEASQRLASVYGRKLLALDELKKTLLHQAFAGQLSRRVA